MEFKENCYAQISCISRKRIIYEWLLSFLLFLMMIAPLSYTLIKFVLILLLIIILLSARSLNTLFKRCRYKGVLAIYLLYNVFSMLHGYLNNAPGAFRVCTTHLLWPILFSMLFLNYNDRRMYNIIDSCIIKALIVITILDSAYILSIYGVLPIAREKFFLLKMDYMGSASDHEISASHTTTFIYGIPYILGKLFVSRNEKQKRRYLWFLLPMFFVVLLTGRRSLLLILFLSPFYAFIIWLYLRNKVSYKQKHHKNTWYQICFFVFLFLILFISALYIADIDVKFLINYFKQGFDFYHDESASVRRIQFYYLMKGWWESPFIGNGLGSYTPAIIRSVKMPWSYELSYCAILFHKGIIGLLIAGSLVYTVYKFNRRSSLKSYVHFTCVYPHLLGIFAFLIAHGTNPYLTTFSNMWYLYLPLALTSYHFE